MCIQQATIHCVVVFQDATIPKKVCKTNIWKFPFVRFEDSMLRWDLYFYSFSNRDALIILQWKSPRDASIVCANSSVQTCYWNTSPIKVYHPRPAKIFTSVLVLTCCKLKASTVPLLTYSIVNSRCSWTCQKRNANHIQHSRPNPVFKSPSCPHQPITCSLLILLILQSGNPLSWRR